MWNELKKDLEHFEPPTKWWQEAGFWVVAAYRFGHWAHEMPRGVVRTACLVAYKVAASPFRVFKNVSIPAKTEIGPGLCIHHAYSILMPPNVKIGSNVTIYHEVTLGRGPVPGVPTIGSNVVIYAGAKILGGITIGDNVEIGANAVVTRDITAGSTVAAPSMRPLPPSMKVAIGVSIPGAPKLPGVDKLTDN